jgi:hypothetical protein
MQAFFHHNVLAKVSDLTGKMNTESCLLQDFAKTIGFYIGLMRWNQQHFYRVFHITWHKLAWNYQRFNF